MRTPTCIPLILLSLTASACDTPAVAPPSPPGNPQPSAAAAGPELARAPAALADVQPYVAQELQRAQREKRPLLVYVGASWCEPCRRFHEAVETGALNGVIPPVRLLEFDHDAQHEALERAGYKPRLLPQFSIPKADGSPSERQMKGSIKGENSLKANLIPRLQQLLTP